MLSAWPDFDAVRKRARFATILDHYDLKTTGIGRQRHIRCPFHQDSTPSCSINLLEGLFHCFGCGAEGTIIDFVALMEQIELRAAAARIAEICAVEFQTNATGAGHADGRNMHEAADLQAERPLPAPVLALQLEPRHPYLIARGIRDDLIELFGLGYCNAGPMRGRICIPIHNAEGNLIAYAGRWGDDPVPKRVARYLVSSGFPKHRSLFNLHRLPASQHVVLVEGYWSVIRLHALAIPAAGLMGSALSREHVELLRQRNIQSITLLMDGDDAGYRARERIVTVLTEQFFVFAPRLAAGEKPDTIAEKRLRSLIQYRCISSGRH